MLKFYETALKKYPIWTNAITTGTLFGLGDVSAQILFSNGDTDPSLLLHDNQVIAKKDSCMNQKYDYPRTIRSVVYGSLLFSFIGDKWYKILNNKIRLPGVPPGAWSNTMCRVAVDQFGFAPFGLALYFGFMTVLEGKPMDVAKSKLKEQWWPTLLTNWAVWPAFQFLNFSIIPVQHRLLAVNIVSIFWNTFLSFKNSRSVTVSQKRPVHYPPVVE